MKHLVVKWNPFWNPNEQFEPRTIEVHCSILEAFHGLGDNQFVWYGKISKSGHTGLATDDLRMIREQVDSGMETHLYIHSADAWPPGFHVGKLEEVSESDMKGDPHTPAYYSKVPYQVAYWFKLSDIRRIDRGLFGLLRETDGTAYDPVSAARHYPRVVRESIPQVFFDYFNTQGRKWFMKGGMGAVMPKCFKTGGAICSNRDVQPESRQQVFIAMPFSAEFQNVYQSAIQPALDATGLKAWKADEEFINTDLMCKVCAGIQGSAAAIVDISVWNANVLFELGLIYGLGKEAFIIKRKNARVPVDLQGMVYLPYDDYRKLRAELVKYLESYKRRAA